METMRSVVVCTRFQLLFLANAGQIMSVYTVVWSDLIIDAGRGIIT